MIYLRRIENKFFILTVKNIMMTKKTNPLIFVFCVLCLLSNFNSIYAQALTDRQTLKQYLTELKKNPGNDELRKNIIQLSSKIYPPVPTPKEYSVYMQNAKKEMSAGTTSTSYYNAISELNKAIEAAPWMPEAYYNIAMLYEQYAAIEHDKNDLQKAISSYKYFLLANPDAAKTKQVQEKIRNLQAINGHQNSEQEKKYAVRSNWRNEVKSGLLDGVPLNSIFKGASLHACFRLGFNFPSIPMLKNNNTGSYTTSMNYYGMGAYAGLELWPLYGQHFGVGGFAEGTYGISGNMMKGGNYIYSYKLNYNYGLNAFLGFRSVKLLVNYSITTTNFSVSTFTEGGWDLPSSKIDYGTKKYGGGLRFLLKKHRKDLDLMVLSEKVDYLPTARQKNILIYHLGITRSSRGFLQLEIAPDYPTVGHKKYTIDPKFKATGLYINLTMAHSFDFYGRRFRNQNW